ncbi:MAG: hypothetical protein HRU14_01700 [Planctomycetes bacterium]|nr:hypothetical protein [Planctomycetota bacterium]
MMKTSLVLPLLAALLFSGAVATPAVAQDAFQNLIPDDALGLIRVKSIGGLLSEVQALVAAIDPSMVDEVDAQELLALFDLADLELDMTKPACFAMGAPEDASSEPVPVIVLPCKDAKKTAEELNAMGPDSDAVARGSYVAFATQGTYTAGTKPSALLNALPDADVILRLNLGGLIEIYRDDVDMGLDMAAEQMAAGAPTAALGTMMESVTDFLGDVVDSARVLDVTFDIDKTLVDFGMALSVGQGTALAKSTTMGSNSLGALAGFLPASHPISLMFSLDMKGMAAMLETMNGELAQEMPEEMRENYTALMSASTEVMKLLGDDMALSVGAGANGLELVEIFSVSDPAAMMASWKEIMGSDAFKEVGTSAVFGEPKTDDAGVTYQTITMSVDWEKTMALSGGPEGMGAEMAQQIVPIMQAIFGSQNMTMQTATVGKHVLIGMGGDTLLKQSIANMKSGGSAGLKATLARAGTAPAFAFDADIRGIFKAVKVMADRMGQGAAVPTLPPGPPMGVGVYAGRSGLVYRAGVRADVGIMQLITKLVLRGEGGGPDPMPIEDKPLAPEGRKEHPFIKERLQIGMVAPDIEGKDFDDVSFKLSDYRGKVVVLDFWGDW